MSTKTLHQLADGQQSEGKGDVRTWNVAVMSAGVALVMFGFNTAQNFVTPLFGAPCFDDPCAHVLLHHSPPRHHGIAVSGAAVRGVHSVQLCGAVGAGQAWQRPLGAGAGGCRLCVRRRTVRHCIDRLADAGARCDSVFVAAFVHTLLPVVLAASVVIGMGSAVLWTAQGVALIEVSHVDSSSSHCSSRET